MFWNWEIKCMYGQTKTLFFPSCLNNKLVTVYDNFFYFINKPFPYEQIILRFKFHWMWCYESKAPVTVSASQGVVFQACTWLHTLRLSLFLGCCWGDWTDMTSGLLRGLLLSPVVDPTNSGVFSLRLCSWCWSTDKIQLVCGSCLLCPVSVKALLHVTTYCRPPQGSVVQKNTLPINRFWVLTVPVGAVHNPLSISCWCWSKRLWYFSLMLLESFVIHSAIFLVIECVADV